MSAPTETLRDARYAIVRVLGEGGQATTVEAVDKRAGRLVAIKRFRVRGAKSWKEVELAEREAHVLQGLSHPALPRYVEHFEEGGELFLVTEMIEGRSLEEWKRERRPFGEEDVLRLLAEAANVLDYLHRRAPPIIHRDLKPSNVILRPDGSFAFIDFGAVRDRMKPQGGSTVVGTFGYMAPEQFQGRAMPASDVYAIGATALSLLTGIEPEDLPHRGLAIDVAVALQGTRVRPELADLLTRMLEPDPDRRLSAIGPELGFVRVGWGGRGRPRARAPRKVELGAETLPEIPPALVTFLVIGLSIAQLAVLVVVRGMVPLLLALMGLREAALATRRGGRVAVAAIGEARTRVRAHNRRVRIEAAAASAPARRPRVNAASDEEAAVAEAAAHEADGVQKRRR